MVSLVERGPDQVAHAGIDDLERLHRSLLGVEHAGDQHPGVADDHAARFEQDAQLEVPQHRQDARGVGGEGQGLAAFGLGFPPRFVAAGQRAAVNDADAAADREELDAVPVAEVGGQRGHLAHRFLERAGLGELRPDVHLDPAQAQVRQAGGAVVGVGHAVEVDPELVLRLAGRDVLVGLGVDVRVHPQGDRGGLAEAAGHGVDGLQFRLRFGVEAMDALAQGVLDLGHRLAHASERAAVGPPPRLEHAEQLAARDDVESRACPRQHLQHRQVRVGLDRITNQMVHAGHRLVEAVVVVGEGALAVDVERGAVARGKVGQAHVLAEEFTLAVVEMVHGWAWKKETCAHRRSSATGKRRTKNVCIGSLASQRRMGVNRRRSSSRAKPSGTRARLNACNP